MKTTVLGIRLNDYQRLRLQKIAKDNEAYEAEIVRALVDKLIEGKIQIRNNVVIDGYDLSGLRLIAAKKGYPLQKLIDMVVEQLNESSE